MKLIDSHCHLNDDRFKDDLEDVIYRSIESGVIGMICIGTDLRTSECAIKIADKYDSVFAACGVHPHDSGKAEKGYLKSLEEFAVHEKVVAIGEMGLDYHYNFSQPEIQKEVFRDQLDLAKSLNLPTVIHNRESDSDLMKILEEAENYQGVVHCFSSGWELAENLINLGLKLSFTGMVTFVKSLELILKNVHGERFMIETDSPFLAPIPYRGKRCEPSYVNSVVEKIAEIQDSTPSKIAETTTKTAINFFNLPLS